VRNILMSMALVAGFAAASPVAAQNVEEKKQLAWAVERGRLLFALDRAAWVATDDARSRIANFEKSGLRGYVVDRDAQGFSVTFYGEEGSRRVAVYRARIGGRGVVDPVSFPLGKRPDLTPREARLAGALEALRKGPIGRCTAASPNIAIVPPQGERDPIDIYVTAPQMRPGRIQFGGHERISFDSAGSEIARRPFSRTCLEVPVPPAELRQKGAMLGVNHVLDPVPTEIHVFIAMAAQQPIVVMTDGAKRSWQVTGDGIKLLQTKR
jgi:hypothetical protein